MIVIWSTNRNTCVIDVMFESCFSYCKNVSRKQGNDTPKIVMLFQEASNISVPVKRHSYGLKQRMKSEETRREKCRQRWFRRRKVVQAMNNLTSAMIVLPPLSCWMTLSWMPSHTNTASYKKKKTFEETIYPFPPNRPSVVLQDWA